jgi:EAL domain-containing protein (putative c-di-GMP-specific phosphodiesterase class I)
MSDRSFRLAASDIDLAFERNEFRLVFQPKVDLATSRMSGAEAFIRWQHPQYGLLPPGLFLDFIESEGRMPGLTSFVFNTAFAAAQTWTAQGRNWTISINVAPGTVTAPDFRQGLAQLLQKYGLKPQQVIIEIPERAVAQEPGILCDALNAVRAMGVQVALDGGGIVPVDLTQFKPMPFNSIKVGGPASIRLAQRLGLKGKGAIAARMRYAKHFGLEAVAVGAEDEPTMAGLADVGFTAAQGIWIQKPLSLEELLAWDGKWARGCVAVEPAPASASGHTVGLIAPRSKVLPDPVVTRDVPPPAVSLSEARDGAPDDDGGKAAVPAGVTKEDMQRVLEAVRAKRAAAHQPTLQPKPVQRAEPTMPVLEGDDLEDIVEDEEPERAPLAGKRQGFGPPGEPVPDMKGLVERRTALSSG